jgi:uncharacterized phage protein (TIGR01671 family)
MREIKFRAWDKANKRWFSSSAIYLTQITGGYHYAPENSKHVELMEWTGLNDKNGKEIYEGDFIKVDKDVAEAFHVKEEGVVSFSRGAFTYGDSISQILPYFVRADDTTTLRGEVIGNVHENPELLNS